MTREEILGFTNRISASNSTGIIAILFDIYETYEEEALHFFEDGDNGKAVMAIKRCSDVIHHLKEALDFNYDISNQLFSLYDFCQMELAKSIYTGNNTGILAAQKIMRELSEAFKEIAENDDSAPVMKNVQKVTAGMTYGKKYLNESIYEGAGARGYFA